MQLKQKNNLTQKHVWGSNITESVSHCSSCEVRHDVRVGKSFCNTTFLNNQYFKLYININEIDGANYI